MYNLAADSLLKIYFHRMSTYILLAFHLKNAIIDSLKYLICVFEKLRKSLSWLIKYHGFLVRKKERLFFRLLLWIIDGTLQMIRVIDNGISPLVDLRKYGQHLMGSNYRLHIKTLITFYNYSGMLIICIFT